MKPLNKNRKNRKWWKALALGTAFAIIAVPFVKAGMTEGWAADMEILSENEMESPEPESSEPKEELIEEPVEEPEEPVEEPAEEPVEEPEEPVEEPAEEPVEEPEEPVEEPAEEPEEPVEEPAEEPEEPGEEPAEEPGEPVEEPAEEPVEEPEEPVEESVEEPEGSGQKEPEETGKSEASKQSSEPQKAPGQLKRNPSWAPSEFFWPKELRIKYQTDMPLEGIPSFITSEMITGALKTQDEYGYPASVTIAQIIQESGYGIYGPGGNEGQGLSYLAYQYNNLFGIKGKGTAGSVSMRTGEETASGQRYMTNAGFRVYYTYTECIEDRAELQERSYSDLIKGVTDANTFAMRIAGRWATARNYGASLIYQMETYDLYRLDRMTLEDFDSLLGDFADPCPGARVTSSFGWRQSTNSDHKGIDLGTGADNLPTYAAAAGTVVTVASDEAAGNWIAIDHGNGVVTKYLHHSEVYVEEGDQVEKGQQIGLSGSTGRSTGNHLHFQIEINGTAVDPAPYLFTDEES